MSGEERYWITTPTVRKALPRVFVPDVLRPTAVNHSLVRARGYPDVFDLSDGLPDPIPIVLKGLIRASSEAELSLRLAQMNSDVQVSTLIDRDGRAPIALLSGSVLAVPYKTNSRISTVTLTFIPATVPTPTALAAYFF